MKPILEALRDTDKSYQQVLKKITMAQNVTIAEWQLLANVAQQFDTQDKLSLETHLDNSTLSRQLNSLVKKELVNHVAVGHDRRQLIYEVTDQGEAVLSNVQSAYDNLEKQVFSLWATEEKSMLQILLNRLDKSVTKLK
ncbi:winged helix-turn-helix transcriptional regulator [Weissella diestrammenae]|uniref:Winged helix-turn-helix transcriptional regulator n=1 Tax=Weissella diestrammenae TaxID=1162633 RepID=A0A7G9T4X6_9LACO|nr:MarR family winged helix-turn-helix transcriptional regulator [Weissella diestrammenae]MCM0582869.1 winged helix-turn-helix transcriptional regulator [Weissella diestrammenae]QNN75151.1 winged helix-turn-helix transcriptional regulator [Weissella diestrammenae]